MEALRFQFGTLKRGQHFKYRPRVFTPEGVAMLSSVLRSPRAVQVNIAIMRVFVRLRETLALHRVQFLFDALRELMAPPAKAEREIGFHAAGKKTTDGGATEIRDRECPTPAAKRALTRQSSHESEQRELQPT